MNYRVRRATRADLDTLVAWTIAEATESEGNTVQGDRVRTGILTALDDEAVAMYWVLEDGQTPIGNVSVVKEWSDWNAGYYWWIQSMYLAPAYRGQGLMPLLLQAIRSAAQEQRALELRLYVHHSNTRAIVAYRTAGFRDADYRMMVMDLPGGADPPTDTPAPRESRDSAPSRQ